MATLALVLAILALLLALGARAKAGGQAALLDDYAAEARRRLANLGEEVQDELQRMRELVARLNDGEVLTRDQILESRLWRDVDPKEGEKLVNDGVHVLDVRTKHETDGGVIPGAQLLPVEELEARWNEVPQDAGTILVTCAAGGRSAAACEFLTSKGYTGLANLDGGMSSWGGPVAKPGAKEGAS